MLWFVAVECGNNTFTKNREKDVGYILSNNLNLRKKWPVDIKREKPENLPSKLEDFC